ncbi:MAG: GNAT family N-acetyltransferase [Deltaproteobacteria bacterium]|nr:GNAT family N-acetyltransferase [Deltaproteobacteria bacterium]
MTIEGATAVRVFAGLRVLLRRASLAEILMLRHAELRPGLPRASAEFAADAESATRHFGAFVTASSARATSAVGEAVACASFMAEPHAGEAAYQLRGMATRADVARRGIGGALLRLALREVAMHDHARLFWCNARLAAVPFYRQMGWRITSEVFDVPSVGPHRVMTFRVSSAAELRLERDDTLA